jgi:hypothetical protein
MTQLLDCPAGAAALSVARRRFDTEDEVNTMAAMTVTDLGFDAIPARRARATGLDRLVMQASLATLLWARRRADRKSVTFEEHALRIAQLNDLARREHEFALRAARVR